MVTLEVKDEQRDAQPTSCRHLLFHYQVCTGGDKAASQNGVKSVALRKRAGIWLSLIATILSWGSTWMWYSYTSRRLLCHMLRDCPGTPCAELRGEQSWHFPSLPSKGCMEFGWTSATCPTWLSTVTLLLCSTCSELPANHPERCGSGQGNSHILAERNVKYLKALNLGCRLDDAVTYQNTPETVLDSYAANKIIRNMAGGCFLIEIP